MVVLGADGDATPVLGAPGYPVSAALTFDIFAAPLLAGSRARRRPRRRSRGRGSRASSRRRWAWTTGCASGSGRVGGQLVATPLPRGAGVLTSLVRADGLLVVPPELEGHHAGEEVEVRLLRGVGEIERTIVATGSHDLVLDLAASTLRRDPRVTLASSNVGSLGGSPRCATGCATSRARICSIRRPASTRSRTSRSCCRGATWRSSGSCTATRG